MKFFNLPPYTSDVSFPKAKSQQRDFLSSIGYKPSHFPNALSQYWDDMQWNFLLSVVYPERSRREGPINRCKLYNCNSCSFSYASPSPVSSSFRYPVMSFRYKLRWVWDVLMHNAAGLHYTHELFFPTKGIRLHGNKEYQNTNNLISWSWKTVQS